MHELLLCWILQKDVPIIREVNNVVGSIVALENSILAPLAPFGRKLQSVRRA